MFILFIKFFLSFTKSTTKIVRTTNILNKKDNIPFYSFYINCPMKIYLNKLFNNSHYDN